MDIPRTWILYTKLKSIRYMDSTHATDMPRTWILHTKVEVSDTSILHSKAKLSNTIQYNELPIVKYPDIIVSNIPSAFAV